MNRLTRLGAALVATGAFTLAAGATVGAQPTWPHDTPSCSLLPVVVATDTVILRNANHAPRHLQLWEGDRITFNEELAPGDQVRASRTGLVMWAGHQYHVADYEGVRWCQAPEETTTTTEPEETTTSTSAPEETTTSTTEPEPTTSTTEPPGTTVPEETTTSTTEPEATTSTTEPAPTTSEPPASTASTGTTVVQAEVLTGQAQRITGSAGNVDPSGRPVDRLPHTGRDTGPIVALGTLLLGAGGALVAHARRVAAR